MSDRISRVPRGGSWFFGASGARVAGRCSLGPSFRDDDVGFRLVEEVEEWMRVNRGSCWFYARAYARVANRDGDPPSYRDDGLGFRLVEQNTPHTPE